MAQPRVAIFFVGRINGWHHVRKTLKEFQETYNATFFVSLNTHTFSESDILFCKYFGLGSDQIRAEVTPMPEKFAIFKNMYSQYYHNDKCFLMIEEYCKKYNTCFDVVVKSRADLHAETSLRLNLPIQTNRIYCPVHDAYQVKDELNYGDFRTMKLYSLLVDTLENHYNTGGLWYGERKHPMLPELVLFQYICQMNQVFGTNIIYFDYKFQLHEKRFEPDPLTKKTSTVAILFPGRIKTWQYNVERLLELKIKYNATFFCSLNANLQDEDTKEFCKMFDISDQQFAYEETVVPPEFGEHYQFYSQHYHTKKCFDLLDAYSNANEMKFQTVLKYRVDILSDEALPIESHQANTLYTTASSYAEGFNDQFYFGDFATMKCICSTVFLKWKDLYESKFFSVDTFKQVTGKEPIRGNRIIPEEYFLLAVAYAMKEYSINYSFFKYFWILHPARRNRFWNSEIEDRFKHFFKQTMGFFYKKSENCTLESYNASFVDLFETLRKNNAPQESIEEVKGILWPAPN